MKGRTKNIKFKFYSKYFFVISLLVLAVFLAGCDGVITPTNQSPTASFTANPTSGEAPLEVSFDASNSTDTDGTIASYAWDFKDGNAGNGETINHTFSSSGSYNVELTITDNKGATASATKTITVTETTNQAPIIISTPITNATVGLLYTYDVNATDPDGDTITYSFYSIYTRPNGMSINSTTGVISWTPTSIQIGDTLVMVKVSDDTLSATQSFTIVVSEPSVIAEDDFESGTLQGGFGWIDPEWDGEGYAGAQPSNEAQQGSYIAIIWGISDGSYIWRSVDLSSAIKPRLQFWVKPKDLWKYFDWKDTAVVQISKDNENWYPIATWVGEYVGFPNEPWSFIDYDLSSYVGTSQFWIKFKVVDNSIHPLGCYPMLYIDDLKIVDLN